MITNSKYGALKNTTLFHDVCNLVKTDNVTIEI